MESAGAEFRNHLVDCTKNLGYTPCSADPDLWLKPMARPSYGFKYYVYILLYVDDAMVFHHGALDVLSNIDKNFKFKPNSIGDPDIYLGAKLKKTRMDNGVWEWANSPARYVRESVKNVEIYLRGLNNDRRALSKKAENPFVMGYAPEMDEYPVLDPDLVSYYQSLIGIVRWMVEIGRVYIIT